MSLLAENFDEYLVSIGWSNNDRQMEDVKKQVAGVLAKLGDYVSDNAKQWAVAGKIAVAAIYGIANAAEDLLIDLAKEDRSIQMLAKKYMVSADAMRAYNNALDEMGLSYEDLFYATDEVRKEFNDLVVLGRQIEAPQGLEDTLITVREILHQFSRFHVILGALRRWIGYYIGENIGPELREIRDDAKEFVDFLQKNIPKMAKVIGNVLSAAFSAIYGIYKILKPVVKFVFDILSGINKAAPDLKWLLLFLLAITDPVKMIAGLLLIIGKLVEDFTKFKNGEKALLKWKGFDEVLSHLSETFRMINDWVQSIFNYDGSGSVLIDSLNAVIQALRLVADLVNIVVSSIPAIFAPWVGGDATKWYDQIEKSVYDIGDLFSEEFKYAPVNAKDYVTSKQGNNAAQGIPRSGRRGDINNTNNVKQNLTINVNSTKEIASAQENALKGLKEGLASGAWQSSYR